MKNLIKLLLGLLLAIGLVIFFRKKETKNIVNKTVLTTVSNSKIQTMDPVRVNDIFSFREISKIYDTLLEYEYLEKPFKLKPCLLEEMPEISKDGLVYIFKIKKGILFHKDECFQNQQERELQARDIVHTIKRIADIKLMSRSYSFIQNKIEGLDEWRKKYKDINSNYDEVIEGIKALDKYTVQIKLIKPYPELLNILAMPVFSIISKVAAEKYKDDLAIHPIGTGAYKIHEYNPQSNRIIYLKNTEYRDDFFPNHGSAEYSKMIEEYGGKKLPFIDKIITEIITEESPRWLKFEKKEIDIMNITMDNNLKKILNESSLDLNEEYKSKGFSLITNNGASTNFFCFNNSHSIFANNIDLRKAISLGFDRETYKKLFFNNNAINAQSVIPPDLSGYDPDYKNEYCEYNPEKAKELLKGIDKPLYITLDTGSSTIDRQKAEFFKKCMKEIGIEIKVITNSWPEYIKKVNTNKCMMFKWAWYADYNSGKPFLDTFYGPNKSGPNFTNFDDKNYNKLYKESIIILNEKDKIEHYKKMNRYIGDSIPAVFLFHTTHYIIKKNSIKNYLYSPFIYGYEKYIDIKN